VIQKTKYAREGNKYSPNTSDVRRELSAELMQRERKHYLHGKLETSF